MSGKGEGQEVQHILKEYHSIKLDPNAKEKLANRLSTPASKAKKSNPPVEKLVLRQRTTSVGAGTNQSGCPGTNEVLEQVTPGLIAVA